VDQPAVAIFLPERPVAFGGGEPVHTFCLLVSPSTRTHLHMLAALATALRDPAVAGALAQRLPDEAILDSLRNVEATLARERSASAERSAGA
jgi:PTS system nitrogen regulatory IIA component